MKNENKKRIFVLLLKTANPNPNLNINNLPGEGRIDILCRAITNVFFLGGGDTNFRIDNELWVYFQSYGKKIVFIGSELKGLNPDERSQAGVLKKVFAGQKIRGIKYSSGKWSEIIKIFPHYYVLDKNGFNIEEMSIKNEIFILGDHIGLNDHERKLFSLENPISLGKKVYLSSQCISILNYKLDNKLIT